MTTPSLRARTSLFVLLALALCPIADARAQSPNRVALKNQGFALEAATTPTGVTFRLHDIATRFDLAAGPYRYRLSRRTQNQLVTPIQFDGVSLAVNGRTLIVQGTLDALEIEQVFMLPKENTWMEERISISNPTGDTVELADVEFGFTRVVSSNLGVVSGGLGNDRFVAVLFRHRPNDESGFDVDFSLEDLKRLRGRERQCSGGRRRFGFFPADGWSSDGWAWQRPDRSFGIFKFNQRAIEFSTVALLPIGNRLCLRFGGVSLVDEEPGCLLSIAPGEKIDLGVTRYETVPGGYTNVYYAFRRFLDEQGCRFPAGYDPPVQWNELYDNPSGMSPPPAHPRSGATRRERPSTPAR